MLDSKPALLLKLIFAFVIDKKNQCLLKSELRTFLQSRFAATGTDSGVSERSFKKPLQFIRKTTFCSDPNYVSYFGVNVSSFGVTSLPFEPTLESSHYLQKTIVIQTKKHCLHRSELRIFLRSHFTTFEKPL